MSSEVYHVAAAAGKDPPRPTRAGIPTVMSLCTHPPQSCHVNGPGTVESQANTYLYQLYGSAWRAVAAPRGRHRWRARPR